ncbi:MAG: 30S ribosomal protein S4 [Clostridia bacterium]|nr:30S ribosomal protein S4 [Clostridia bacterium]
MARTVSPSCKMCRREGQKLYLKGDRCTAEGKKCAFDRRPTPPGQHGLARHKNSEYGIQLREKQKVRRIYGVLEGQFHGYYERAERMKGVVGENMLALLEKRLDNVVYRMGIGASRAQSRQIVNHGHITVNGKVVDIASYQVKVNDEIAIKESKRSKACFTALKDAKITMPKWVSFDTTTLVGKILDNPKREDIDANITESLIIEKYSK